MIYRRTGRSGLMLPALSVGLWQRFGGDAPSDENRAIIRRAFELGVTHFDLANNYGPPYGSAESNFGRMMQSDLKGHRDELVISTKAGWDMWPGRTEIGGLANTCSRASTRASSGWASSMSTSSITTALTPRVRSRKRWAPSRRPFAGARRCMSAFRSTSPRKRVRPWRY